MKFCSRPFEFMWVARTFDSREKSLTLPCPWLKIREADDTDLTTYSVEEVWMSQTFQMVRQSIINGSFRYCNCKTCPFISNNSLPEYDEDTLLQMAVCRKYPVNFGLAYDRCCNHACPSCRNEIYKNTKQNVKDVEVIGEKLLPYLNKAAVISSNGQGDFFGSAANMQLFERLRPENPDLKIWIETNGTLFDAAHWKKIAHLGQYNVSVEITPNSYDRDTYAYLNGGFDTLKRLEDNLCFVKQLRKNGEIKKFVLITVVQDTNVKEIPEFIRKSLEEFEADEVIVRPIYKWNFLSEEDYWFKNVSNPLHPYHEYYKRLLESEWMKDSRVYNWNGLNMAVPIQHPAYRYKEISEILSAIVCQADFNEQLESFFHRREIKEIILYGTDELGKAVLQVLGKTNISVKKVLNIETLSEYNSAADDVILITNYHYKEAIIRDLEFMRFSGRIFDFKEVWQEIIKDIEV